MSLKSTFEVCLNKKPNDAQVITALGILNFIQRDYNRAGEWFAQAIKVIPTDYSLWNKYGACMSLNHDMIMAIEAYQ